MKTKPQSERGSTRYNDVMDPVTTFKVGKKEFVVIEREEFERLTRTEMDRIDIEIGEKALKELRDGKVRPITHDQLLRKLGRA